MTFECFFRRVAKKNKGTEMVHQIEKVLDEQIRPALASHGGDLEIVDFEDKKL